MVLLGCFETEFIFTLDGVMFKKIISEGWL